MDHIRRPTVVFHLLVIVVVFFINYSHQSPSSSCNSVSNIFKAKAIRYPWWGGGGPPSSQGQGQGSCHKSTKCCGDLAGLDGDLGKMFREKWVTPKLTQSAGGFFTERKENFDEKFKEMLAGAHTSFHGMFERTYGMLYIQHASVFHALFTTLEKYYTDGNPPLEQNLNSFFQILSRKMFQVLNAQYEFDDAYLSCATIVISEKQGNDLHRQIVSSLRRSFVASRALSQGLGVGGRVVDGVGGALSPPKALSPLLFCPICTDSRAYKPCLANCLMAVSPAMGTLQPLIKHWTEYIQWMDNLVDRLLGPYNIEAVVEPIHIKISEIIMNFQENGVELSQVVFSKCGKPKLGNSRSKRSPAPGPQSKKKQQQGGGGGGGSSDPTEKTIEKLLKEIKNKLKKAKLIFDTLPKQICNAISKDFSSQLCWNGTNAVRPTKDQNVPEVKIPPTSSGSLKGVERPIQEQISILMGITEKLKNAYNGIDVQWVDEVIEDVDSDDFGSGSGSGESPSDLENDEDDNPDGIITHTHPQPPAPPRNHGLNITISGPGVSKNIPHFPPIIGGDNRDRDHDSDHDSDERDDDDGDLNLTINSNESNGGIRNNPSLPGVRTSHKDDDDVDFMNPPTTTTTTSTQRPPLIKVKTTTNSPIRPKPKNPATTTTTTSTSSPITPIDKLDGAAGKALAIIKLFTPVFMNILEKMVPF